MNDTEQVVDPITPSDSQGESTPDSKEQNREGYKLRQLEKQLETLRQENEGYKRRDEAARLAKLSEEQRVREEVEALKAERDQLHQENLRRKVAKEFSLPDSLMQRLVGSDEDSLRADAEELANLLPKRTAGTNSNPVHVHTTSRVYTREELAKDPILARSAEVLKASREGRVK